jgi:chitinase
MASINYAVTDNWGSGFVGSMTVAGGNQALHGWTVEFDAAFGISDIWGAVILSHDGTHYVIGNLPWNSDVTAGANTTFGFQATSGAGGTVATGLTLDGAGVAAPPPVLPTLSIADASISEGNVGSSELSFTVSLSQAATGPVTVKFATGNGTATAGSDYTAGSGTVTFAAGETSKVVKVAIAANTAVEANETLKVTLSAASGATIARATATGAIVDDDTATPPSAGTVSLAYSITSNWGAGFTGDMKVGGGSAPLNGWTVEFNASFSITNIWNAEIVSHVGNHYVVKNAAYNSQVAAGQQVAFGFQADAGSGGTQATGFTVNGTAVGPNPDPTLSVADATVSEGDSGTHDLAFTVSLSAAAKSPVTVKYGTTNGTATAGSDYTAQSGTLTFAAGETSKVVHVPVQGDKAVETNETLALTLSSPSGAAIVRGTATGTITNDDVAPSLSIGDATFAEGSDATPGHGTFAVTLSKPSTSPVTVHFATSNGTATAGSDYVAKTGTLTFAAGETTKTISVAAIGDSVAETNEGFTVALSNPTGATIARGTATGTITNDDVVPSTLSISNATFAEGSAATPGHGTFTVTLSKASTSPVTVHFATSNGTATAGSDYVAKAGTLTFAAGETSKTISVAAIGDAVAETNEGFTVVLSNPTGATIARGTASGTITNDDGTPPSLRIGDATFAEGIAATPGHGTFTVTLSKASTAPVTVKFATSNGTATAGRDYVAQSGTLTFAAGQTTKAISIAAIGDSIFEPNEGFTVALSNATGATLADATGAGTITNDDVAPLPTLRIGDSTFAEGSAASPGHGTFTVTLSQVSTSPVTVHYRTANGTATAGSDYVAKSGTLTFEAGETTKTVSIAAIGDSTVEANEGFTVVLSNAVGATIADGTGAGTITNDDVAPLPTLSIGDTSVVEGNPGGSAGAPGWLSTSGNQIIDSTGHSVQIAGVNWFGFEGTNLSPNGLWTRGYKDMMNQMASLGFNTIRLPFSSDMLHSTAAPQGIDFSKNPDLQGLTALQIMDKIVDYAGQVGLKIILDHHRSDPGAGVSPNGLWYDAQHSQADWVSDWAMLATRYADKPQVIGADLHNEPYNGTWGGGGPNDWAAAAEQAGNAIGHVNPNWLVFVEGIGTYQGQSYWWGGNLMGVKDRPIQLDVANKLVYSAHDYPNSVYPQPWFQGSDFPANLPAKFDQMWGYIYKQNIAPVYIGEFGTKLTDPKDAPWLAAITSYLGGDLDNNGTHDIPAGNKGVSWTFWSWNPNSGDTGGILQDDWNSVNQNKLNYLKPIEFDFDSAGGSGPVTGAHADFLLTLSAPATGPVTVQFHTVAGDATSADFTASSGSATFAAGEQSKTISIPITADLISEANEHFTVVLTNASGATISRATGTATIVDDDGGAASSVVHAAAVSAAGDGPAHEFSPYIDMAMAQDADLVSISRASGIESFTLAFMLSSDHGIGWQGTGAIADDTLANHTTILHQVEAIQAQGGHITISFGGAAGQEAALTAPNAATLQAEYQSVIDRYHIDSIDFDIEGAAVADQHSIALRDQALVGLQAGNPDLKVSFTLPVLPTGLDANGLNVLRSAQHDGVKIDVVNIMAMDYGSSVDNNGQMGQHTIQAAVATQGQLHNLGLDAKIGITPMIGVNDISFEVFTLADAQALVNFAQSDPNIVRLSMWSVARDNGATAGAHFASPDSSGVAQTTYEYAGVLNRFDMTG